MLLAQIAAAALVLLGISGAVSKAAARSERRGARPSIPRTEPTVSGGGRVTVTTLTILLIAAAAGFGLGYFR